MAYGKYPFPFVDLIQTLISQCREEEVGEGKNKGYGRTSYKKKLKTDMTPWLLRAFLMLGEKFVGKIFLSYKYLLVNNLAL
jgi:hypothetical protein